MGGRYAGMLAVVSTILGALAMFIVSTVEVGWVIGTAFVASTQGGDLAAAKSMHHFLTTNLVEAVDGYLLGTVLLVFSVGLYKLLFPSRSASIDERYRSDMFSIETLDDLKNKLAKVIILILVVNVFEYAYKLGISQPLELVYLGAAAALAGLALYFSHAAESRAEGAKSAGRET